MSDLNILWVVLIADGSLHLRLQFLPQRQHHFVWCEDLASHVAVTGGQMALCSIIPSLQTAGVPVKSELLLIYTSVM
jgi:hypothetical protein